MKTPKNSRRKPIHRAKLIEKLADLEEIWRRQDYAKMLGLKNDTDIYRVFSPAELSVIEKEALALRRQQYARHFDAADKAMFKAAAQGNVKAAKLLYERFENLGKQHELSITGFDDLVDKIAKARNGDDNGEIE